MEENIMGKGENASIFSFSHHGFQSGKLFRVIKSQDYVCLDIEKNEEVFHYCMKDYGLFVSGFMLYQGYFSYSTDAVHKSMFPGLSLIWYLTSPLS